MFQTIATFYIHNVCSDAFKYVHSKYHCVNTLLLTVGETFEGDIGEIHASEGSVKPLTQRLISRNYTALAMTLSEFLPSLKDANGRVGLVIPPHGTCSTYCDRSLALHGVQWAGI